MEYRSNIMDEPLAYRFVRQSGRKVDKSSHSTIRSHAMKGFRKRQRQQKQLETIRSDQQSVDTSLCRCSPLAELSLASPEQHPRSRRVDTPSAPFTAAPELCSLCGRVQSLRISSSQQMNDLQQLDSTIATFAAADFDPFNSITELPPFLTSKFSSEINIIKSYGWCKSP